MRNFTVRRFSNLRIHTCPKNATSSINQALPADGSYTNVEPEEAGDEPRFMVVRHPCDRMVSAWACFCIDKKSQQLFGKGYWPDMPFPEFYNLCLKTHDQDQHTRKQIVYAGPHKIDWVCSIENLNNGWEKLRNDFSFLKPLERRHTSKHDDWRSYFSNSMLIEVEQVFKEDMELYEKSGD